MTAAPTYWDAGVPKLNDVVFRFIGDPQAQAAALRAGDVDAFPNFSAPELFDEFKGDTKFEAAVGSTTRKLVAGLNNEREPLKDVRVRQAMMMAIDRKTVMDAAYSGYGIPIGSHFSPIDAGYIDLTSTLPYDVEKAKALLAEAGYPNGFKFTIQTPQMSYTTRAAQVLQAMLSEIGITLEIAPSEFPAKWIDQVFMKKDYDMTIVDHAEPLDIDIYARPNYYFNYHNPSFNEVVEKAGQSADDATRAKLYEDAQTILAKDVPALYLFDLPRLNIWNAKVRGLWKNEPISQVFVRDAYWAD